MPIRFPCPHCQKVLSVKDHLAGKKGPCPACKKILAVPLESTAVIPPAPAPVSAPTNGQSKPRESEPAAAPAAPPPDAEAAAAAALADEPPPPEETAVPQFIDFTCSYCDEALHLAVENAGKRVPCPECKRIVKVPELKKIEKADWRKTNAQGLPSGARRPDEPVPEGAWGNVASSSVVSREALEEADVLPDRYQVPLTVRQKITRGVILFSLAVSFLVLVGMAYSWWASSRESRTLKSVQDYASSPAAVDKIGSGGVAALYISLGEYQLRSKKPGGAKEAQTLFSKALETLTPPGENRAKDHERDALLGELALLQTDLGGSPDDVDQTTRLTWNDTQGALGKTLRAMRSPEARLDAYRAVCRRLVSKNEGKRALALAPQLSDSPTDRAAAIAVAGLEMLAAKQSTFAETAADDALALFSQGEERPLLTPSVIALAVAVNRSELPMPTSPEEQDHELIGQAEGLARQGKWEEARRKAAAPASSFAKLQAYIALAAVGDAKSDNADLQQALKLAPSETQNKVVLIWLKLRLVDLAARVGVDGPQLEPVVASIEDRDLAGHARLVILRYKLAAATSPSADSPLLTESPPTLAHYRAVELLARRQRKFDADKADEADRPFGVIGAALGTFGN